MTWTIRPGGAADARACHAAYVDAIRNGTAPLYTAEQAKAWAPADDVEDWMPARLENGITWIAERDGRAAGFLTFTPEAHLDFFFVRPEARSGGLAGALYDRMIAWAKAEGHRHLTTHANHLARSFLLRRGWRSVERETAIRRGVALDRRKMETDLPTL
jgi:putative acetyltransferase